MSFLKKIIYFLTIVVMPIFIVGTVLAVGTGILEFGDKNVSQKIEKKESSPDEIVVKQREMRNPTVLISTRMGSGSGTIIESLDTDSDNIFEYIVLTNAHVTQPRLVEYLTGVDSITSEVRIETIDTGCGVLVFNYSGKEPTDYIAKVIAEDIDRDLAILSFESDKKLPIARIPNDNMIDQVRVFDEVFAVGCQLGNPPSPTFGIISRIESGESGAKVWTIYINTAHIMPGSSGGGLYKKYGNHYYLIGIPNRISMTRNGHMIPHMSHAVSMKMAKDFINNNSVSYP